MSADAVYAVFSHFCDVVRVGDLSDPVVRTLRGASGDVVTAYACWHTKGRFLLGGPKIALRAGGWHGRPAKEGGGGVPEMGFCAGPFVLCKDGCCRQRCRNTNFWPGKIFFTKKCSPTYV